MLGLHPEKYTITENIKVKNAFYTPYLPNIPA
jgi:hypothetical protein